MGAVESADHDIVQNEGVAQTGNVAYLTMQVAHRGKSQRVMVAGFEPGKPGAPAFLVAGRPFARAHYEAVADAKTGFAVGDVVRIRRNDYTVVGLTRRMVSSGGDPMLFIPLKDAQEAQFLKDNDAIVEDRKRLEANPAVNRPGQPGVLDAVSAIQTSSHKVNAVLLRLAPGVDARAVADTVARWQRYTAYTRDDMEEILVAKLIATAARQIGYDRIFVRPSYWLAETFTYMIIDRQIIDGFLNWVAHISGILGNFFRNYIDKPIVNGFGDFVGEGTKRLGRTFRFIQSGKIQQYMIVALVSLAAFRVLFYYLLLTTP